MRPGITLKLFLAILLASACAAGAMAVATRFSFQSGFLGYLNQVDAQRLDALAARLADEYRRAGDWNFLRDDYGRLRALALPAQPVPRLTLLDEARRTVVGNPEVADEGAVRPVLVDGRTVGWVARTPLRRLSSAAELSFQQEQLHAAWIIAAFAVALAAVLAIVLARVFLLPLRRVAEATHRLAAGNYATRVAVRSSDELGRLGEDFNRLAQALERNEALRRRFMADVSHELRTPLAVLSGELEALEDGVRPIVEFDDSAPGVPPETLPQLFERFYRVEGSRSRANGGSGLGLAICRSIAAAHGGDIAAAPSPLGGLRVSVSLPVAE